MRFRTEHVADSVVKRIFTVAKAMRTGAEIPKAPKGPDVSKLVKVAGATNQEQNDVPTMDTSGMPAASDAGVSLNDTLEQGPLGAIMEQEQ